MAKSIGVSQSCKLALMALDRVGAYTGVITNTGNQIHETTQESKYVTGKGLALMMGVKWSTAWRKRMQALRDLGLVDIRVMLGQYWYRLTIHGQSELDIRAIDACEFETWKTGSFATIDKTWSEQNV